MNPKRILLTGDDGYNSIGTRLLINALKDDHQLNLAATKHQQTGVGGMMSLKNGGTWGETVVDGVAGVWVDGSPADAVQLAKVYYDHDFDLVISGINLGINASSAIISSGTYGAAIRAMGYKLAPKGLVLSWNAPHEFWHKKHDENEDLTPYLENPGMALKPLFKKIFDQDMWGVDLLNINFPDKPTNKVRFTKIYKDMSKVFHPPMEIDREKKTFSYEKSILVITEDDLHADVGAVKHGYISITPCVFGATHYNAYHQLRDQELTL